MTAQPTQSLPCVGCGKLVERGKATVDADGWWHPKCEQAAWESAGMRNPVTAPFKVAWQEAKRDLANTSNMTRTEIENKLRRMLADQIGDLPEAIKLTERFGPDLNFDSLDVMDFVNLIHAEFGGLTVPDAVAASHFSGEATVQSAIDWIEQNTQPAV